MQGGELPQRGRLLLLDSDLFALELERLALCLTQLLSAPLEEASPLGEAERSGQQGERNQDAGDGESEEYRCHGEEAHCARGAALGHFA